MDDFFSLYFSYTKETECPALFHRWCAITGIGAYLGRRYSFAHGHFTINPNTYCMLIGTPGTRKSTSVKLIKKLLTAAGYSTIAADKTSKEKFLLDLSEGDTDAEEVSIETINLFGEPRGGPRELFIAADEFNDFIGLGNLEFISLLGSLWDYSGVYKSRLKNSKSVAICDPTISILGGNTPTSFSMAFPPEILGQGFFSRLLLVYGETTGVRIPFPPAPAPDHTEALIRLLYAMRESVIGTATTSSTAQKLLEKIYTRWSGVDDVRFDSYSNRRFTHLLKLCLVVSASRLSTQITEKDVIYANTILTHTEHLMPKALGEFGKSRHSDTVHKIMQVLESSNEIIGVKELWKHVMQDLEKLNELVEILRNLTMADKILAVNGGFLAKRKLSLEVSTDTIDTSLLTKEELGY